MQWGKKQWLGLAKILVSLGLVFAIYKYFLHIKNPERIIEEIKKVPLFIYVIAAIGSIISWMVEAQKWKILMQPIIPMKYSTSVKSTLGGAAVSNIFPFRVGEYLGRVIWVKDSHKLEAAITSVAGSMAQMFITLLLGIPPAAILLEYGTGIRGSVIAAMSIMAITFILLRKWALKKKSFRNIWWNQIITAIKSLEGKQMGRVLAYSLLRYGIFSFAYAAILIYSGLLNSWGIAWCGIAVIYLLQSFAPGMLLTDAGVRTALPIFIFGNHVENHSLLLGLAIINYVASVLLPGVVGMVLILLKKRSTI